MLLDTVEGTLCSINMQFVGGKKINTFPQKLEKKILIILLPPLIPIPRQFYHYINCFTFLLRILPIPFSKFIRV